NLHGLMQSKKISGRNPAIIRRCSSSPKLFPTGTKRKNRQRAKDVTTSHSLIYPLERPTPQLEKRFALKSSRVGQAEPKLRKRAAQWRFRIRVSVVECGSPMPL